MHLCCPMEQSHCVSPRMPVHCLRNNYVPSHTHKCTHAHQHCSPRRCMEAVWQSGLWLSSCQFELLLFPPETIHPLCSLVYLLSYCTNPRWHYFRLEPYLSTQWNCFDFVFKKYEFYVHLTEPIIFCYSHTYWQVKVSKMRQLSGVFHV